jgi:hypothetical protein
MSMNTTDAANNNRKPSLAGFARESDAPIDSLRSGVMPLVRQSKGQSYPVDSKSLFEFQIRVRAWQVMRPVGSVRQYTHDNLWNTMTQS